MAATTIDQYVTPRDSQVIFSPSPFSFREGGSPFDLSIPIVIMTQKLLTGHGIEQSLVYFLF